MTEVLGRYRIDEVLSRGGSATTYKAHQAHLDRSVLLKVLHPSLTKDERSVERFSREARAVAKIRHPGIVHIYDYGKADEFYYIAMEFVEGLSLAELLDRDKRMPVDVATYVAYQCSKSLAYAHSKGVVHRDIKPGNIILAYNGGVKITDFGLAYSKDLTSITIDGELFGTPSYMSPEQIRGEKIDERTDIYSLGLTFYQMVSGVKCFEGDNYPAIITKKLTEDVVPLRKIVTDCPQRLANIVSKAVERNAARRYQSMDDLSHDLEGFAKDCGFVLDERAVADYLGGKSEGTLLQVAPVRTGKPKRLYVYLGAIAAILLAGGIISGRLIPVRLPEIGNPPRAVVEVEPPPFQMRPGTVFISSVPEGAAIFVDGVAYHATTPASITDLEPGEHELALALDGYQPGRSVVAIEAGDTARAEFSLRPLKGLGFLKIDVVPWAVVHIDGDSIDTAPSEGLLRLDRGRHELVLTNPDFPDYATHINVSRDGTTDVFVDLSRVYPAPLPSGGSGFVKMSVVPWAVVYIDGDSIDTTPFNRLLTLDYGRHKLLLSNPDFPDYATHINVPEGETTRIFIDLKEEFGFVMLRVNPWADVYVDGEYKDTTPLAKPIPLSPGQHLVRLIGPSSASWEKRLTLEKGKTIVENVVLPPG